MANIGAFILRLLLLLVLIAPPAITVALSAEGTAEVEDSDTAAPEPSSEEGIVAHYGEVTAYIRFFADAGVQYDSSHSGPGEAKTSFYAGSFDFFSAVRIGDHIQTLSEIVGEFEDDTNEGGFEVERLWGKWSMNDAFYAKIGREHAPVSHWNRRFHHGRILWPAVTQPFLARFEDDDGPLPIHHVGLEMGGVFHLGAGALSYTTVVSNGRGFEHEEVTNAQDRNRSKAFDVGGSFSPSGAPGLVFGGNYRWDEIPPDPTSLSTEDTSESIATFFVDLRAGHVDVIGEAAAIRHDATSTQPEFQHHSWYLQANYRHGKVEPFLRVDVRSMDQGDPFYLVDDLDLDRWDGLLGMRVDLGDHAAFKVEAGRGRAEARDAILGVTKTPVNFASAALQWMF